MVMVYANKDPVALSHSVTHWTEGAAIASCSVHVYGGRTKLRGILKARAFREVLFRGKQCVGVRREMVVGSRTGGRGSQGSSNFRCRLLFVSAWQQRHDQKLWLSWTTASFSDNSLSTGSRAFYRRLDMCETRG